MAGPVPIPRTFSPNEIQTGAYLNSVRDWANFFNDPPHFKGSFTSSTGLSLGVNLAFPVVEDNYSAWDSTNHDWVVPAGCGGLYLVSVQFKWNGSAPATAPAINVLRNGTAVLVSANSSSVTTFSGVQMTGMTRFAAGDTVAARIVGATFTTQPDTGDNNFFNLSWYAR